MKFAFLILLTFLALPGFTQEVVQDFEQEFDQAALEKEIRPLNPQEELKKLGYTQLDARALLDERVVLLVQNMFKQNGLYKLPEEQVRQVILDKFKGSNKIVYDFVQKRPKLINAMVAVMRDKEAMPAAIGLFLKKDLLKKYFFIWIGLMLGAYFFKRATFNKKWSRGKTWVMSFLVSLAVTSISLTTFYQLFHAELSPAANILYQHWRRRNL